MYKETKKILLKKIDELDLLKKKSDLELKRSFKKEITAGGVEQSYRNEHLNCRKWVLIELLIEISRLEIKD